MRMRLPLARLVEGCSKKSGTRFLAGEIGSLRLVIVERETDWMAYLAGETESAAASKTGKRRAPKAPRRAMPKKRAGTMPIDAKLPVPNGEGYPFDDPLTDIGRPS